MEDCGESRVLECVEYFGVGDSRWRVESGGFETLLSLLSIQRRIVTDAQTGTAEWWSLRNPLCDEGSGLYVRSTSLHQQCVSSQGTNF